MAKRKKKSGKKKSGHRKNAKRSRAAKRAYKKSGLYAYNMKKKRKGGGRKKGYGKKKGKKSGKKKGRAYRAKKHSILGYKAAAKHSAAKKAAYDKLIAQGKPPEIANMIVARAFRKKTKSKTTWAKDYAAQREAERVAEYMRQNYARSHSYN